MKWNQPNSAPQTTSTPAIVADGHVYFASGDGCFSAIDINNTVMWWIYLHIGMSASPMIGPDGVAYVPADTGKLFAFSVSAPLMNSSWPMFRANPRHTGVVNVSGH
jgi:outer membrane protein assembly factor BamB